MQPGRHEATIEENSIRVAGTGTEFVNLIVSVDGERISVPIWMSEGAISMAYAQLERCGFDPHGDEMASLDVNKEFLAGRKVLIDVEEQEYKGKTQLRASIVMDNISTGRIADLQRRLRAVKPKPVNGPKPATTKAPLAKADDGENIPF